MCFCQNIVQTLEMEGYVMKLVVKQNAYIQIEYIHIDRWIDG